MNPEIWAEIVAAHEDATRFIEAAFVGVSRPSLAPEAQAAVALGARSIPDLAALHARLYRRLDELLETLTKELGKKDGPLGLMPLTFLLDEQVELSLASWAGDDFPDWPQLQRHRFHERNGGEEFYVEVRALLRETPLRPLLVALYLYCLEAGFKGLHFETKSAIESLKEDLAARLTEDLAARLGPAPAGTAAPPTADFRRARPRWHSLLAAAGAVLAFQIVLLAIARVI